jgi:hypothetical protein
MIDASFCKAAAIASDKTDKNEHYAQNREILLQCRLIDSDNRPSGESQARRASLGLMGRVLLFLYYYRPAHLPIDYSMMKIKSAKPGLALLGPASGAQDSDSDTIRVAVWPGGIMIGSPRTNDNYMAIS